LGGVLAAGNTAVGRLLSGDDRPRFGPTQPVVGNAAVARMLDGHRPQRAAAEPQTQATSQPFDGFMSSVRASGQGGPLPAGFREEAESSFGSDFSGVRVHNGPAAAEAARSVSARAFTVGADIYFGAGRYDPDGADGRRLLAHELTHVVQQNAGAAEVSASSWLSQPGDATEQAADAAAERFARGEPVGGMAGRPAGSPVVARDPETGAATGPATAAKPGKAGAGPLSHIPLDGRRISFDPATALQQLREIAVKEGVKAARYVPAEIRLRRGDLGLDKLAMLPEDQVSAELKAEAVAYELILTVLDAELGRWKETEEKFQKAAEDKTTRMLDFSQQRLESERDKYGLTSTDEYVQTDMGPAPGAKSYGMADNAYTMAMAAAARQLVGALGPLQEAVKKLETIQVAQNPGTWEFDVGSRPEPPDPAKLAAAQEEVRLTQERYLLLCREKQAMFPVLGSFADYEHLHTYDLKGVRQKLEVVGQGAKGGEKTAGLLGGDVLQKLENVATVRAALKDGDLNIWGADNVVGLTKVELGYAPNSIEAKIVDQKVADVESARTLRDLFFGAFAVALGLLAAPVTGGGSVVAGIATAGGAALSVGLAVEHLEEYQLEKAANATDYDKANLISSTEPSLFWLAVDILFAGIDAAAAAKIFKNLAATAKGAVSASPETADAALKALQDVASAEAKDPAIGASVRSAAERERKRIGLHHGTDQSGLEGTGAVGRGEINVARSPGEGQDLGQGFYMTLDRETAEAYGFERGRQRGGTDASGRHVGGSRQHVLTFELDEAELGKVVDVRPGGNFAAKWEEFLAEPPFPVAAHVPGMKSNREYLLGAGVERRGEQFEKFLAKIGMTDADVIIAPLGNGTFTGITAGKESVQVCIRSQKVADRLNALIRGAAEAAGPNKFSDVLALSETGTRQAKGGRTHAGREYQKHMARGELPVVPGKDLDSAGQDLLDGILMAPDTKQFPIKGGNFKDGQYFVRPDGVGAAFDKDGVFQYFGRFKYDDN
jgi:hypothetical protein